MKTDNEIKEWIDSREVVTQTELIKFMYGYYTGVRKQKFTEWWAYIIETKDLVKLRQYSTDKQLRGNRNMELFNKVKSVYTEDPRLQQSGCKSGIKLLKTIYGIEVALTTYKAYLKQIKTL